MSSSQSGKGTVLCDDDGVVNGFMVMRKKTSRAKRQIYGIIGMYSTLPPGGRPASPGISAVVGSLGPENAGK